LDFCSLLLAEPEGFLQGHDGPAYDIKFYGDGEDALLLRYVCGQFEVSEHSNATSCVLYDFLAVNKLQY
jgi:hypothetical protein